jgi:hypothetical protein
MLARDQSLLLTTYSKCSLFFSPSALASSPMMLSLSPMIGNQSLGVKLEVIQDGEEVIRMIEE